MLKKFFWSIIKKSIFFFLRKSQEIWSNKVLHVQTSRILVAFMSFKFIHQNKTVLWWIRKHPKIKRKEKWGSFFLTLFNSFKLASKVFSFCYLFKRIINKFTKLIVIIVTHTFFWCCLSSTLLFTMKATLNLKHETGQKPSAKASLAVAAGDVNLKATVTEASILNKGLSLEGVVLALERPNAFIIDYNVLKRVCR